MSPLDRLLPGRIYPRSEIERLGIHPRKLADGTLLRVFAGCFARADAPPTLHERARVLQRSIVAGSIISHSTAARLYGFPLPRTMTTCEEVLHCRVPPECSARRGRWLSTHPMHPGPTMRWAGLTLSHPLEVLREIAGDLTHVERVMIVDAIAGGRWCRPLQIQLAELRAMAAETTGRGSAAVREACRDARENVWSPQETRTRLMLLDEGFAEPVCNAPVVDPDTGVVYRADVAYPELRIAIEYDGKVEHMTRTQWANDLHKNEVLHRLGWTVLRISAEDLLRPRLFLARLRAAMARGEKSLSSTNGTASMTEGDWRLAR